MEATQYFQRRELCLKALNEYRGKIEAKWPLSAKLELYNHASRAFDLNGDLPSRQRDFNSVSDILKGAWVVGRNGSLASSEEIFGVLDYCLDLHCNSSMTLMNLRDGDLAVIAKTLTTCKDFKRQKSGAFPFVVVSKVLHACNPRLFVIYDNSEIDQGVYPVFRNEWNPHYKELKGIHSAPVPPSMAKMFDWYLSYLLWASRLLQYSYDDFMKDFATWALSEEGLEPAEDTTVDLRRCYATAFDCVIIGAKYLELGK
jgi:hypothetical protein